MAAEDAFEIRPVKGKGVGVFATRPIGRGTLLISEAPLFTTASLTNPATFERDLGRIIRELPKESQRAFLSLHNNSPGSEPFSNIVRSNGYPLGPGSDVGGIFPLVARMNHACNANCQHAWDARPGRQQVHAVRDVAEGEELTLAYHVGGPKKERQAALKTYFGFQCECELCSLPKAESQASDERMEAMARLDEAIGVPGRPPMEALADCKEILRLYGEERVVDLRVPRAYYDAFQICAKHSDEARAAVFAKRAEEARRACEGASEEAENLQSLAANPRRWEGFGKTKKLKTVKEDMPSALSGKAFEKWLWRS